MELCTILERPATVLMTTSSEVVPGLACSQDPGSAKVKVTVKVKGEVQAKVEIYHEV